MKNKYRLILLSSLLIFGFSLTFGHFYYPQIYSLYVKAKKIPELKYEGRNFDVNRYEVVDLEITESSGVFLTYGQSNATNSGEPPLWGETTGSIDNVYQFLLGNTYVYRDPSLGANGLGRSVWGLVGRDLIEKGVFDKVIFANSGYGGESISNLKDSIHFNFLTSNYNLLIEKYGKVDAILFHQGESDNSEDGIEKYYKEFSEFLNNLSDNGIFIPVYLSRASMCGEGSANEELTNIQNRLISDFELVKEGPNTDLLTSRQLRFDYCHFSQDGLKDYSNLWVQYLVKDFD
jgi:hypothetical protein